nr:hypothetical protein [Delftia sp. SD018]
MPGWRWPSCCTPRRRAGGLGDLAIRYGYERYETRVMFEVIVILVALVSVLQFGGEWLARRADHRRSIS